MLNTSHYTVIAGNPAKWDEETLKRCRPGKVEGTVASEDLCAVQVDQHNKGRRGAVLTRTIYGWSVRADSGLENFKLLAGKMSRAEAIAWGTKWVAEDPDRREFYATNKDLALTDEEAAKPL